MFKISVVIVALSLIGASAPASALQASDSLQTWKKSSAQKRSDLLSKVLGKPVEGPASAAIRKCLDETSEISGHADLEIGEVVKGCQSMKGAGDPV